MTEAADSIHIVEIRARAAAGDYQTGAQSFDADALELFRTAEFNEKTVAFGAVEHITASQKDARLNRGMERPETAQVALDYAFFKLARAGGFTGLNHLFNDSDGLEAKIMNGPLGLLREHIIDCRVKLSGPIGTNAALVEQVRSAAYLTYKAALSQRAIELPQRIDPNEFQESFLRSSGQLATLQARLDEHNPGVRRSKHVLSLLPDFVQEFTEVTDIFMLTDTHMRAKRHPVLDFTPDTAREFVEAGLTHGFTMSQIRTMASRAMPHDRYATVTEALQALTSSNQLSLSTAKEIAVDHANPEFTALAFTRRVAELEKEFAGDDDIRSHDIKHFIRNHGIKNAADELRAYRERVAELRLELEDDPLITPDVMRTAARRSKNPRGFIRLVQARFQAAQKTFPSINEKLLRHAARNFTDPIGVLTAACESYTQDPHYGAQRPRTLNSVAWKYVLNINRPAAVQAASHSHE